MSHFYGLSRVNAQRAISYMREHKPKFSSPLTRIYIVGGVATRGWSRKDLDIYVRGAEYLTREDRDKLDDLISKTSLKFNVSIDAFEEPMVGQWNYPSYEL